MSRYYYSLDKDQAFTIRGTVKLLNVASSRYGGDWHSVPHTHNHTELFYIVGGKGQFLIEDQVFPVDVNNLVIINPNVTHTEDSLNAQPLEYIVLGIEGIELATSENSNGQFCLLDHFESVDISSCLRNILREMEQKNTGYEDVCQAFMEILIIRLMRSTSLAVPAEPQFVSGNRQCAAVRRYIDLHFKEALTLEQLAEEAHMNKYYLSHAFKREYGVSPINYMISRRIEESKYLLAETDLSMSQIAQLLGFSSLSYFSQVFRRTQSITPMEYRQSVR
ncbi:MAG: helix-turn-helix transcriptional regulator [Oscillospiraceae bacterium]|nr:helix-turn-helix transcriptional regulator [Oscillospiraceae bacterium]